MAVRRDWLISAVVVLLALGMTACSSRQGSDALLIYNAQHESLTKEWIDAFTKETGIKVEYRQGGDTELGNQLIAEGGASPADVFLTENSPAMAAVEHAGLFADLDAQTTAQVPPQYRPASGKWTGVAARTTVFVYNKDKVRADQLPASLMDLQQPQWKGRWGAPPAKADFQAIVAAMLALTGEARTEAWLAGMKANAVLFQDNIATLKAVNAGEVPMGIMYHYYWYRDQALTKEGSANTKLHYFKGEDVGAFVSVSAGGVLKASTKQADAQKFLAWVTSAKGQEALVSSKSMEYAVGEGVASDPALPPLDSLQAPSIDPFTLDGPEVIKLMTAAGIL